MRANEVYGQLTSTFLGWGGFLKDPNYVRANNVITWQNQTNVFLPEQMTRVDTLALSKARQFSFRVSEDDSLLQIAYTFRNNEELASARLAYLEVGEPSDESESLSLDEEADDLPVRWLRIDYAANALPSAIHAACHLHLSGHPNLRLALKGVPSPAQFVEFTASLFYSAQYAAERLNDHGQFAEPSRIDSINNRLMESGDSPAALLAKIPHLLIPGY